MEEQCLLTAAVQNMKKIARILWKKDHSILSACMLLQKLLVRNKARKIAGFVSELTASYAAVFFNRREYSVNRKV